MHFAFLFPRFKILSGAERLILKLSAALVEKNHRITILSHQFDDSCRSILSADVKLITTGRRMDYFRNRYFNAAFDYFRSSSLARMLQDEYDAVCCFGPALAASPAIMKSQKFPVFYFCYEPPRFLYTDREVIEEKLPLPSFLINPVFKTYRNRDLRNVQNVTGVLSNSYFGAAQIQKIYGRSATVITHGIDPYQHSQRWKELRQKYGFTDSDIVVLTVNYLHPRKRIDLFLQTIAAAQKENPSIKGLVVGDGPERDRLLHQADAGTSSFTGFIPDGDLFHYYQAADIYLQTGRLETFGLSVIEAAGNGLPVVSVNEGGPCETVLDSQTGYLTEANVSALSKAICILSKDAELRKEFGKAGQESVRKKYKWEQGAQDFLNAFSTTKVEIIKNSQ
jgi:glycosyltransferase involved in cell wall biosynthesis